MKKNDIDFKIEELQNMLNKLNVPEEYLQYMAYLISENMEKIEDEDLNDEEFEENLAEKMRERFPDISEYYIENAIKYIGISSMLYELEHMLSNADDEEGDENE